MEDKWMLAARPRPEREEGLEFPPNGNSLDLLRAIYRCAGLSLPVRMRAAMACLPFETPKLSVVAQVNDQDFATILDQRIKHFEQIEMERSNGKPMKQIEANGVEIKPPKPHVNDRRYRRI